MKKLMAVLTALSITGIANAGEKISGSAKVPGAYETGAAAYSAALDMVDSIKGSDEFGKCSATSNKKILRLNAWTNQNMVSLNHVTENYSATVRYSCTKSKKD